VQPIFLLEKALRHGAFLFCYLLVGMGATGFDFLFCPDEVIPSIGVFREVEFLAKGLVKKPIGL